MANITNQKRARRRLAKVRLADPNALPNVKPTESGNFRRADRYAILHAIRDLRAKGKQKAADNYDPLAPLRGKDMSREIAANEDLRFGPQQREVTNALTRHDTTAQLSGTAYDQYAQAVKDARDRINTFNRDALTASEGRVDSAYVQDKAAADARDKALAEKAKTLGLAAAPSAEAAQVVEAQRTQGNAAVAGQRGLAQADNTMMEDRAANAVLGKAEAQTKLADKRRELEGALTDIAKQRGEFRVSQRGALREGEREWAAVQKEFNLKETAAKTEAKEKASDRRTQEIVAKIYASADKASARAQIRVAKIQLEKGKIDQKQYRHIVNEYRGLPEKGKSSPPKDKRPGKTRGGSGPGGSLAPWEVDARDRAENGFKTNNYSPNDHRRAIQKAVQAGIPKRLAESAWKRYLKSLPPKSHTAPSGPGTGTKDQRPT